MVIIGLAICEYSDLIHLSTPFTGSGSGSGSASASASGSGSALGSGSAAGEFARHYGTSLVH